jgi:NAD(P)-dependent dehydrogenase (short-subunit alcohol dehydrogenase family)
VPNAGLAHVATLEDLDEEKFRQITEVNTMGVFQVIQAAIPIFKRQALLGKSAAHIIINSSKNVFAPGAAFGAYSSSKAGAHQLGKIAAMELAPYNVRVNMINGDAIFDDHGISSGLWDVVGPDRMRSRNLDPAGLKEYYRERNLLKTEILADHVGNAVVFFASSLTPTTGATLPVDGGVAAAFPR